MTSRNRVSGFILGIFASILAASPLAQAQVIPTIYWQGGNGTLTDSNYTDLVQPNLAPTANDVVYFGGSLNTGVSATLSTGGVVDFYRLRIGHNEDAAIGPPDLRGAGTVTVSGGAQLNLVGGDSGTANSGLTVGNIRNGTLIIDGAGSSVTSSRLIVIGTAPGQPTRSGRIQITNGGSLIATAGNINLGLGSGNGQQGHLEVDGTVRVMGGGADLEIGDARASSSFTQTGGTVEINDFVVVATQNSGVANGDPLLSQFTFNISGGTFTNGNSFILGRGASQGAKLNISGGQLSVGNRLLVGEDDATGVVVNHTAGTLTTTAGVRVANNFNTATNDATYNLSGTGVVNGTTGGLIGRRGTGRFLQTGGTATFGGTMSIGHRETSDPLLAAADGLYKISAGSVNFSNLTLANNGTGQFRVVGQDATIGVGANLNLFNTADGFGTLAYELEAGESLSTINVVGTATFAAGTSLLLDASNASPGQNVFHLVEAASIVDEGLAFTGPAGWTYDIVNGGLGQILRAVAPGVLEDADFDQDGDVDGADFLTWQRNLAPSGKTLATGDANGNGAVNGADLAIWRQQYGSTVAAVASVPEPAAGALLLVGAAIGAAWRRRRSG